MVETYHNQKPVHNNLQDTGNPENEKTLLPGNQNYKHNQ